MAETGANKLRVLIVDDEDLGRRLLRSLLASDRDVEIIGEARSAPDARRLINELQPDLVFMDIEIQGGNGIEVLKGLELRPCVIFVTAHPEFALPAIELQAVDYLVKPVQRQRFFESVHRAKQRIAERLVTELALQIAGAAASMNRQRLTSAVVPTVTYPNHMTIRVRRRMFSVDLGDISWIQGASQYSRVHTRKGEYLLSRTLGSLECELDPDRFFRIHRSAIVNAAYVSEVRSSGDGRYNIYLQDGKALPMGRARRGLLEKLMGGGRRKGNRVGRASAP